MTEVIKTFSLIDLIDILIISYLTYRLLLLFKGSKTIYMFFGVIFLLVASFFSNMLKLTTTSWLLDSFTSYLFLILIIVFQPEFRRVLAALGEPRIRGNNKSTEMASYLDEIIKAVIVL
ncbi:MAG: TIGR00159 family protein, partial [Deferribacterota bacterium]|nr:TIGR00159 family protein [Deferribacterota bacterium]